MGRWDFKTTPGWHWESIKPGGQARFRVKDSWIEETPAAKYPGLALLAGGEMSTGRSFSDPSSDHYLYIAESRMSRDRAHSKIIDKLSTAIRIGRAAHGTGAVHGASGVEKRLPVGNIFRGVLRRRETEFQLFVHGSSLFSSLANIVRAANAFTSASYRGMSIRQLSPWPAPGNV